MSNEITKTAINEFKSAWTTGMENIYKACKIYVTAIDKEPEIKQAFRDAFPQICAQAWSRIENTGRGQMHYALLCDTSPAAEKLRKLPFSEQKKAIEIGFEVLTDTGDVLKVKTENLTRTLINQVIAKDHIRDIPAQKAYRESQKIIVKLNKDKPSNMWQIKGNTLVVVAPTTFTRQQLLNILQDIG